MAKKKTASEPMATDAHTSGFLIRLPEHFRPILKALQAETRRPMTQELQLALEKHLRELGKWP